MANFINETSNTLVSGTSENDFIDIRASQVTINTGNGNNTVFNGLAYSNQGNSAKSTPVRAMIPFIMIGAVQ